MLKIDMLDTVPFVFFGTAPTTAKYNTYILTIILQVMYRNFERLGPRTNGGLTTLEEKLSLPVAGDIGFVVFRARDENGRKRGAGGNTWNFAIVEASTGSAADHDVGLSPRFEDMLDGTYK
jgi:hypothetical protein